MSSFLNQTSSRKPTDIDLTHQEVNEYTIQGDSWGGVPVQITTMPIEGIQKIELIQTFVSDVAGGATPTYPWFDLRLDGIPNNRLAGDAAVIRLYNLGERTRTDFTNRVVYQSNNPKGHNVRSATAEFRRPDGGLCPAADIGAWSIEFRITRVPGFRV